LSVPLKHINRYRDRHGKWRYYYRPPGAKNAPLTGEPGTAEFAASYEAAVASKAPIGESRNPAGGVSQAIALYLESSTFARLAPDTRRTRRNELERFRQARGQLPVALMEQRHLERYLEHSARSNVSIRNCIKALSPWLRWCLKEGLVPTNAAASIERPRSANAEGYQTWDGALIERYRAHHPLGTKARTALEVIVNVGSARVDTAALGRQHIRNGMIVYRRSETKVLVEIPILPDLQEIIDGLPPGRLPLIARDDGTPYTKESFGNLFRQWCDEAGIPKGYAAHGIRKYAATIRAELGATVNQLMAWFGWLTEKEAVAYTRAADRRHLAAQLGQMVNASYPNLGSG
jgi:hypothetical protein